MDSKYKVETQVVEDPQLLESVATHDSKTIQSAVNIISNPQAYNTNSITGDMSKQVDNQSTQQNICRHTSDELMQHNTVSYSNVAATICTHAHANHHHMVSRDTRHIGHTSRHNGDELMQQDPITYRNVDTTHSHNYQPMVHMSSQQILLNGLPMPIPKKFSGDALQFPVWRHL